MKRFALLAGILLSAAGSYAWSRLVQAPPAPLAGAALPLKHPAALIDIYCAGCHASGRSRIDLDGLVDVQAVKRDRATWKTVARMLRSEYMPPEGQPRPSAEEREFLIGWIEDATREDDTDTAPAPFVARRLQRHEYVNTIRDLVGVSFQPGDSFPADERDWEPYHNVPVVPASLRDQYAAAADRILADAIVSSRSGRSLSASHKRIFIPSAAGATKTEYARAILTTFARRAYRRPLDAGEAQALVDVYAAASKGGRYFKRAIKAGLKEILTSPPFLYRIRARVESPETVGPRHEFDLASRLSYFLWSSTPDDELLNEARRGTLHLNLHRQTLRMLRDPRSRALAEGFTASWLELGKLTTSGAIDETLQQALRKETELFVARIFQEDRSVLEFLDADYTYVNERLARHYGIGGVQGDSWQLVSLEGTQRGGLLTQGSILALTSRNNQTSPVARGKWVLDHLLGTPPPAPPAGILDAALQARRDMNSGTARQRLEHHRANPSCAQCHEKMDAFGFALENFDATGSWRTHEFGQLIDPSVTFAGGTLWKGPADVRAHLKSQHDLFIRCLAGKLLSYALGRKLEAHERAALETLLQSAASKPRFSGLLQAILSSPAFLEGVKPQESLDLASADSPRAILETSR